MHLKRSLVEESSNYQQVREGKEQDQNTRHSDYKKRYTCIIEEKIGIFPGRGYGKIKRKKIACTLLTGELGTVTDPLAK